LGDSDQLMIGEWVVALGNPLGLFDISKQPTATVGIISGVRMDFGQQEHGRVYQDMIQTDASINPGNSGGPLVNADGQVVGINSFIFTGGAYTSGSIGIGFAIPINRAKEVVEELKTKGRVDRSFTTGIEIDPIDPWIQNLLGLPTSRGVLVTRVGRGSAGEEAGLKVGDVILEANGKRVGGKSDILAVIEENLLRAGDVLHLKIWRDGKARDIDLVLGTIER
jgi:serine protease Do